ncbi:hypothetical protein GCM10011352_05650 [Marinobacterium zhoushanense]|uniref:Uncharacterized protein n=1 Tax=Marinobacterium zhoushanense TaxID=1679163 RepID=A0ABQ1K1Y9_9GAMM|nr:hypothetical protein GCM10011352_05650 [Marinobacterium zhoushanense]
MLKQLERTWVLIGLAEFTTNVPRNLLLDFYAQARPALPWSNFRRTGPKFGLIEVVDANSLAAQCSGSMIPDTDLGGTVATEGELVTHGAQAQQSAKCLMLRDLFVGSLIS